MCARLACSQLIFEIPQLLNIQLSIDSFLLPNYNVHSGSNVPVIFKNENKIIQEAYWGFSVNDYRMIELGIEELVEDCDYEDFEECRCVVRK